MKKLQILNKSVVFLLYFAPFLVIPQCSTTKENPSASKTAKHAVHDDSAKVAAPIVHKEYKSPLKTVWDFMLTPTPTSFSGFGLSAIATVSLFADGNLGFATLMPLGFLILITSLVFLFFKNRPGLQIILSGIVFLCISLGSIAYINEKMLWGYYAILLVGFIDVGMNTYNYRRSRKYRFRGNNQQEIHMD